MGTQIIRTSSKVKVTQLKKLILNIVKANHPWVNLPDIHMHIYLPMSGVF